MEPDEVSTALDNLEEELPTDTKNETKESKKKEKNKPQLFETFTKLWVSILLIFAIIDLQLSYILAYLGRDQIAESLSVAVVTEVIGVSAVYMIRAHFDTKSEKSTELETRKFEYEAGIDNTAIDDDSEAVG
jgi:uncharacterized membrane-anchored protein